jgi:hypothetical protein
LFELWELDLWCRWCIYCCDLWVCQWITYISAAVYMLWATTDSQFLCEGVGNDPREDRYFSIPKQVSAFCYINCKERLRKSI